MNTAGIIRGCATATALLLLAACQSAPHVRTRSAPGVDLGAYRTYAFVASPSTDRHGYKTLTTRQLETSVAREMEARGYVRADAADLVVNFNVATREKLESWPGPGLGAGFGGWRHGYGWGIGVGTEEIRTVTEGTLTIDVVDRARKELIWSGSAIGELTAKTLDNPDPALDRSVALIFAKYPRAPTTPAPAK
jgi:hypothetical protein